jgi:hypothetical protein
MRRCALEIRRSRRRALHELDQPALYVAPFDQDAPRARFADEANVRAEANDPPCAAATRVRFTQAQSVARAQL